MCGTLHKDCWSEIFSRRYAQCMIGIHLGKVHTHAHANTRTYTHMCMHLCMEATIVAGGGLSSCHTSAHVCNRNVYRYPYIRFFVESILNRCARMGYVCIYVYIHTTYACAQIRICQSPVCLPQVLFRNGCRGAYMLHRHGHTWDYVWV